MERPREHPKRGSKKSHAIHSGDVSALLSANEGSESESETEGGFIELSISRYTSKFG